MIEYVLILLIGLIGGVPMAMVFAKVGAPIAGFAIWLGIFLFAVWAVWDITKRRVH